jgi:hypothetical protein
VTHLLKVLAKLKVVLKATLDEALDRDHLNKGTQDYGKRVVFMSIAVERRR